KCARPHGFARMATCLGGPFAGSWCSSGWIELRSTKWRLNYRAWKVRAEESAKFLNSAGTNQKAADLLVLGLQFAEPCFPTWVAVHDQARTAGFPGCPRLRLSHATQHRCGQSRPLLRIHAGNGEREITFPGPPSHSGTRPRAHWLRFLIASMRTERAPRQ